jgi:hypothetical protein
MLGSLYSDRISIPHDIIRKMGLKPRRSPTGLYCWCNAVYLGSWDDNQVLNKQTFFLNTALLLQEGISRKSVERTSDRNSLRVEPVAKPQKW